MDSEDEWLKEQEEWKKELEMRSKDIPQFTSLFSWDTSSDSEEYTFEEVVFGVKVDKKNKPAKVEQHKYTIRPPIEEKFNVVKVKELMTSVIYEELEGKKYDSFKPEEMNQHLCQLILQKLSEFPYNRYKYAIELVLAEQRGQGMGFCSSCLWDSDTDNVATAFITTEHVICAAVVFGVYHY